MGTPASAPRVLCVAGSPRPGGNSARLLEACIDGIESAGGIADVLSLSADPVPGCTGCNLCEQTGACALTDSMTPVYQRLDAADAVIVASPVYFATVPATLKAFLDRFQPYWASRYVLGRPVREPRRPGGLLLARGGGDPFGWECAVAPVKSAFAVLGVSLDEVLEVEGPDAPGEIDGLPATLERAREIGRTLVAAAAGGRQETC